MGLCRNYLLAFMAVGLAVPVGVASSQSPTVSIETDYLMTFELMLDPPQEVGSRRIVNVPSGSAHGPKINGNFITPTADWVSPQPDGSIRLDVRGTIRTDDGETIFVEYNGVIVRSKEVVDRFNNGEVITSKDEYFVTAPRFTTASKKYGWLNQLQAVGKMVTRQKNGYSNMTCLRSGEMAAVGQCRIQRTGELPVLSTTTLPAFITQRTLPMITSMSARGSPSTATISAT